MSTDENACILALCTENLHNNVRMCVLKTFNKYIDEYQNQLMHLKKEQRAKKVMKKFQVKLRFIAKNEDCADLHEDFYERLVTTIDYLDTLLAQITKLKIQLLSRIRTVSMKELDIDYPDKKDFAKQILQKNAFQFFHCVPLYYQYYTCQNSLSLRPIVDNITSDTMDEITTHAYSAFFSAPKSKHSHLEEQFQQIISASKNKDTVEEARPLPKDVEDAIDKGESTSKTVEKKIELDDEDAIGVDLKSLLQKVKADSEKEEPKETTDNTTKEEDITETPPEKEYGADDDELEETI